MTREEESAEPSSEARDNSSLHAGSSRESRECSGYISALAVRMALARMPDPDVVDACHCVQAMIDGNEQHDDDAVAMATQDFFAYMAARADNRVIAQLVADGIRVLQQSAHSPTALFGSVSERREWFAKLRTAVLERDADYAEYVLRRGHHLADGSNR